MNQQGYEQLTLFPVDSPASPFLLPGSEEARRTTAISGRKCSELLQNCGPVGSLVKMLLESSTWRSTRCFLMNVPRLAQGVKDRVGRLKCLGNAVVPQQFYPAFRAIAEIEQTGLFERSGTDGQ